MATLAEQLLEHGIRPRSYAEGNHKLLCPKCSHTRKNRTDPCLSLLIDDAGATWNCWHCEWRGGVKERGTAPPPPRRPKPTAP
jgi:twinkle protein